MYISSIFQFSNIICIILIFFLYLLPIRNFCTQKRKTVDFFAHLWSKIETPFFMLNLKNNAGSRVLFCTKNAVKIGYEWAKRRVLSWPLSSLKMPFLDNKFWKIRKYLGKLIRTSLLSFFTTTLTVHHLNFPLFYFLGQDQRK